jgi:hypothetical protein
VTPNAPTIAVEPLRSTEYPKKSPAAATFVWIVQEGGFEHDVAVLLAIKTHGVDVDEPSTGVRSKNSTLPATALVP